MNSLTDPQLLRDYTERRSQAAFTELVGRHVDLVYSAAFRMVCYAHLAEDVTRGAFVALAQNVRQLTEHPVLSGWLHRTTQNLAAKAVRSDGRHDINRRRPCRNNHRRNRNCNRHQSHRHDHSAKNHYWSGAHCRRRHGNRRIPSGFEPARSSPIASAT